MTDPQTRHGATPAEWDHLTLILGLTADLLPVVSNPHAEIGPTSELKGLGKTPSRYNALRKVVGIKGWPQHQATNNAVAAWSKEPDYGVCVITRTVRAIDIDIGDWNESHPVTMFILEHLAQELPCRVRDNSAKCLLAFSLPGDMPKRVLHVEGGIIEFLATGQQFIACGTHPSGARYEWEDGLPDEFPTLTLEQFESLWTALDKRFSIAPSSQSKVSTKAERLTQAAQDDPVAAHLYEQGHVRSQDRDGRLHIVCPWQSTHTNEATNADTSTTYWPAHTGGYVMGHFKCLHAHCTERTDRDFKDAVGYVLDDDLSDFDDLGSSAGLSDFPLAGAVSAEADCGSDFDCEEEQGAEPALDNATVGSKDAAPSTTVKQRFPLIPALAFSERAAPRWIIKGILPMAELVILFGESGAGKSFTALDLAGAVARGIEWRGNRTRKGRVVYIAAEGAGGFRNRLLAYAQREGIALGDVDLHVIAAAPNLLERIDALDVARSIGKADLVFVDTLAQATAGSNENSGEDMGKALSHCKGIHRATGATVVLVHHAGKDLTKGARGWSGLRAAADAEIEVSRQEPIRMLRMTKQKDGEDGKCIYFDLTQVPIGMDEDGDTITSCVMNYDVTAPVAKQGGPKLNQWETLIMTSLTIISESQSAGIEKKAVVLDALEAYKTQGGVNTSARDLLNRAVKTLATKEYFIVEDDCIELLKGDL